MQKMKVRDCIVPVADFPRIKSDVTFAEAAKALKKANDDFLSGAAKQRITLVEDQDGKVLGKLSPLDLVRGLEPGYDKVVDTHKAESVSSRFAGVEAMINTMASQLLLTQKPLADVCRKASGAKVEEFLRPVTAAQTIQADSSLNEALHRCILGRFDSLFVLEGKKLAGILRFSDLYEEVYNTITTECRL